MPVSPTFSTSSSTARTLETATWKTAELRDNLTFIVAGHETTALTLAWALYLAAFDQGVQDRARAEARAHWRPRCHRRGSARTALTSVRSWTRR